MIRTYTIQDNGCGVLFVATKRQVTILVEGPDNDTEFNLSDFDVRELMKVLNGEKAAFQKNNNWGGILQITEKYIEVAIKNSVMTIKIEQIVEQINWVIRETAL